MVPSADDELAPGEAARLLGVSPRTLLRWLRNGRIPYELGDNGEPRVRREDVMRLVDPRHPGARDEGG